MMKYNVIEHDLPSIDGIHTLKGKLYVPEEIKGIYHLVHGMIEHIGRYDKLLSDIAQTGWLVAAFDNLGHGRTAEEYGDFGYIGHKDGWKYLIEDVYRFGNSVKDKYKNLPYILHGHSMGSFIVRNVVMKYPDFADKLVIMGTGGPNPALGPALKLAEAMMLVKDERKPSPFLDKLAFGKFNERFKNSDGDWLSKDPEVRRIFDADRMCDFKFSISALHDLVKLNAVSNSKEFYKRINKNMPILMVSGADDPVGDYGKGVKKVYDKLKESGANVRMILYKNNRHEIHNDTAKERLLLDLLKFAEE